MKKIQEKRDRLEKFIDVQASIEDVAKPVDDLQDNKAKLKMIDVEMLDLVEKQRKRAKRAGTSAQYDLEIGDIHHRPVIVIALMLQPTPRLSCNKIKMFFYS